MAKIADFVSVTVIIGFLTFVWAGLVLKNVLLSLIVALSVVAVFLVIALKVRRRGDKPYQQDRLALELAVKGPPFLVEILKSILQNKVFDSGFNFICLENALIYVNFKFSNVTLADMPTIYATATKYNKNRVFLFAKGVERKALRLLENYGIYITVVKIKAIYKLLKKHGKLPVLSKPKYRFSLKDLPAIFLSKSNVKGLIFSGVVLIVTAFFTPLKIYYLVFGSLSLLLALLSFSPLGKETPVYDKLLDLFDTSTNSTNKELIVSNSNDNLTASDSNLTANDDDVDKKDGTE